MNNWKDIAYKENTDAGWLREQGHSDEFIKWVEDNNYRSYDGFDRWIHTPSKKLYSLDNLINFYETYHV